MTDWLIIALCVISVVNTILLLLVGVAISKIYQNIILLRHLANKNVVVQPRG
jgi:hypothetical protein